MRRLIIFLLALSVVACTPGGENAESQRSFDIVLEGGDVYSGADAVPVVTDIGASLIFIATRYALIRMKAFFAGRMLKT